VVVVAGCVVDVVARAVVVVDDRMGARVIGAVVVGAVVAGAVVTVAAGAVVGAVATVVVDVVAVVVVDPAGTEDVLVEVPMVEVGGTDGDEWAVAFSAVCRLARFMDRDPPGGPTRTSAPMHRAANAIRARQPRHASHVRCCRWERSIASSSTNGRLT
jgi:hypothetical protein